MQRETNLRRGPRLWVGSEEPNAKRGRAALSRVVGWLMALEGAWLAQERQEQERRAWRRAVGLLAASGCVRRVA
jgi:hypothetical protein